MERWLSFPQSLYDGKDKSITIAARADNWLKNRFVNVCVCKCSRVASVVCVAWEPLLTDDDNRVVLRPLEGHEDCQSDYINASYVDVSHLFHEWH